MLEMGPEFSHRTREESLRRFAAEEFDFLVVGGGITGAAVARDLVSRGCTVALVERGDFANGTSSRSSKLIHGGLRYLENFEFGLVFEALAERALLLRTAPHRVRPLPFYFPVYQGDPNGRLALGMGMWLYDLLSLFRAPGFHRSLSRKALLSEIPFLKGEGLKGGFRYFDASMWDDALTVETLRSASKWGAAVANYVEALEPLRDGARVAGFRVVDRLAVGSHDRLAVPPSGGATVDLRARQVILCAGPWADEVSRRIDPEWKDWLNPSKGVHLVFDLKRVPVPGAMVMSHPEDGRISFVIPRPDFGPGVVIVGTTDGPTPRDPDRAAVEDADIDYLLSLLRKYFPALGLTRADILSAYVGVRPLMAPPAGAPVEFGDILDRANPPGRADQPASVSLQKVSREHHIGDGPGGTVLVAGGKYTTHRRMAAEIVDFALKRGGRKLKGARRFETRQPVNPAATSGATAAARTALEAAGERVDARLWELYGAEAAEVGKLAASSSGEAAGDPEGFPALEGQLRFAVRAGMVMRLEDFYLRRVPLFAARADGGLPWADRLARVLAGELGLTGAAAEERARAESARLREEAARRSAWRKA